MKKLMKYLITIGILNLLILTMWPAGAEVDYDIEYEDLPGDVQMFAEDDFKTVSGFENIDITSISSSKSSIKQNLILEMTVVGTIEKSDLINYQFSIMDGEEFIYWIAYQNGTCTGSSLYDSNPDILVATGADTDTLTVTVPIKKLGEISDYNFNAAALESEVSEEDYIMYMDNAPDYDFPGIDDIDYWEPMPVFISNPVCGSTEFDICEIAGTTYYEEYDIEYVEVQIDSTSEYGWITATTDDNWQTWECQWDTRTHSDGKSEIHARAYDRVDYYYDSITVYVNQQAAISPKSVDSVPNFQVGDYYQYKVTGYSDDQENSGGFDISGTMSIEIIDIDTIEIAGTEFDVYVMEVHNVQEISDGIFSSEVTMDGKLWVQRSDLGLVKEDIEYKSADSGFPDGGEYYSHDIIIYDPPMDKYNFPISVCEQWDSISIETTESTTTYDGETTEEQFTSTTTSKFECLRADKVSVPAGAFNVFLIYSIDDYEDSWESSRSKSEDSDGNGWADDEDEYYFTYEEEVVEEYEYSASDCGYTIEYYSPEIGYPVKVDNYDYNRELIFSCELVSYKYGDKHHTPSVANTKPSSDFGFEIPNHYTLIAIGIIITVVIIIVGLVRRRKNKESVEVEPVEPNYNQSNH